MTQNVNFVESILKFFNTSRSKTIKLQDNFLKDRDNMTTLKRIFEQRKYSRLKKVIQKNSLDLTHIFDVGVRDGTPELYRSFAGKEFVLFDPMKQELAINSVHTWPDRYEYRNIGLGAEPGELILNEQKGRSSFLKRTALTKSSKKLNRYTAKISTLDIEISSLNCSSPLIGLKIDTEGYELEVLKGLNDRINNIAFIELEMSLKKRFVNSYSSAEIINHLDMKGFSIAGQLNTFPGEMRKFIDLLVVNRNYFPDY